MNDFVLAGDLGGTNLRVAAIDDEGRMLARLEDETPRHTDDTRIIAGALRLAKECGDRIGRKPLGLGFALPAIMSGPEGRVFSSPNLPELNGSLIGPNLREGLSMDVVLENDANAAAIGENWLGASQGSGDSICLTLGTGVGGGIILDGRPHRGPDGTAGEIGHVCVEPLGPRCGCGSNGCLEQFASATAVVRVAREIASDFSDTKVPLDNEFTALDLYNAGTLGDRLAVEVFRRVGYYLGIAIGGIVNVLNPEVVVLGGGMSGAWDLFIGELKEEIMKRAFHEPAERARIVRAKLGSDAGLFGAARLAFAQGTRSIDQSH
ncbi:MAG: ROK family protein [Pyrinomonadaceae bacterium]